MTELAAQLTVWPLAAPIALATVPHSENRIYRLGDGNGGRYILRLHRPGYHTAIEVQSELAWIGALRRESGLLVPEVVATRDGQSIARLTLEGPKTAPRLAVLFVENSGAVPDETDPHLPEIFEALGAAAARCHLHVQTWTRPDGFLRPDWTIAGMIGRRGIWGDWRAASALSDRDAALLMQAEARLLARFDAYGMAPDRYGLIHNDLRPSNFLWEDGQVRSSISTIAASAGSSPISPHPFRGSRTIRACRICLPAVRRIWPPSRTRSADIAMAGPALMARRMLLWPGAPHGPKRISPRNGPQALSKAAVRLARRFLTATVWFRNSPSHWRASRPRPAARWRRWRLGWQARSMPASRGFEA